MLPVIYARHMPTSAPVKHEIWGAPTNFSGSALRQGLLSLAGLPQTLAGYPHDRAAKVVSGLY